jgi:hypothetical protein
MQNANPSCWTSSSLNNSPVQLSSVEVRFEVLYAGNACLDRHLLGGAADVREADDILVCRHQTLVVCKVNEGFDCPDICVLKDDNCVSERSERSNAEEYETYRSPRLQVDPPGEPSRAQPLRRCFPEQC